MLRRKLFALSYLLLLFGSHSGICQCLEASEQEPSPGKQVARTFPSETQQSRAQEPALQYWLYLPNDYEAAPNNPAPLLLFLHGGGEGGTDLERVQRHGPPKLISEGKSFPFIVVSPQNPSRTQFWDDQLLIRLLEDIVANYNVDPNRIYLSGLSRGGYGAWRLAIQNPTRFAALVPISGGGPAPYAVRIKDVPIWVFHGAQDKTIPIEESQRMVEALRIAGSDVRFTAYPETGHDAWTTTYASAALYDWLLQQRRRAAD